MKGKRGQSLGIAIILAIMIFLMGIPVINILKPEVATAVGANGLDCANTSISDGNRLTCLAVDLTIPYFIWIVISAVGGLVISRFLI